MLLEINFTLVLFALSFLVFIYFLNLTLFKPVGKVIEERKSLIETNYKSAKELTNKATSLLENHVLAIKSARHDAQHIIQGVIDETKREKEKKIQELMTVLNKEKETALANLAKEKETVMAALKGKINMLKDLITNKVLGTENTLVGTHT